MDALEKAIKQFMADCKKADKELLKELRKMDKDLERLDKSLARLEETIGRTADADDSGTDREIQERLRKEVSD